MRHPNLPPEQTITVAAIAAAHHQAAGWQLVEDKPARPMPTLTALEAPPAVEDGDTQDPVAPKRRRTQKEDI